MKYFLVIYFKYWHCGGHDKKNFTISQKTIPRKVVARGITFNVAKVVIKYAKIKELTHENI